jgi:hypothetical protein
MHSYSPPFVLHALPISSSLTWLFSLYLEKSTPDPLNCILVSLRGGGGNKKHWSIGRQTWADADNCENLVPTCTGTKRKRNTNVTGQQGPLLLLGLLAAAQLSASRKRSPSGAEPSCRSGRSLSRDWQKYCSLTFWTGNFLYLSKRKVLGNGRNRSQLLTKTTPAVDVQYYRRQR